MPRFSLPPLRALLRLGAWYGAWAALAIFMAKPMGFTPGAGAATFLPVWMGLGIGLLAFLLMDVFAGGSISGPHLIGAIILAGFVYAIARVVMIVMLAA